jgi:hypothetical protein
MAAGLRLRTVWYEHQLRDTCGAAGLIAATEQHYVSHPAENSRLFHQMGWCKL